MKILNAKEINTLSIKVTEEINKKNLHSFLKTSIINSGLDISKNSYYYFYYNKYASTYEILFYEKVSESIVLEPFLVLEKYPKNCASVRVYITNDYFVIVQNNKLLIFKKVTTSDIDEISSYIKQIYKIEKFEMIQLSSKELSLLKQEGVSVSQEYFYPLYHKNSFRFFMIFSIFGFILLLGFLYIENNKIKNIKSTPIFSPQVKTQKRISVGDKIDVLFKNLKSYNIVIEKIEYENGKFQTIVYHKNKTDLLNFANLYINKIQIKTLKYDDSKKLYAMEVIIEN